MRMSCNGCRVLRKGCSDDCSIRPCLQWIKSPESQANATVFLAKFYGRAGLLNLINAGPDHLRPAIFRSLLYEACGRIVNPIYGSVGLLWSGSWHLCQAAVEAVLRGAPIIPVASDAAASSHGPPLKVYDIRHVSKEENSVACTDPPRVRTRCRFKRSAGKMKASKVGSDNTRELTRVTELKSNACEPDELNMSTSYESSLSHQSELPEAESMVSVETAEPSFLSRVEPESVQKSNLLVEDGEVELELTLGFEPASCLQNIRPIKKRKADLLQSPVQSTCTTELRLDCRRD